MKKITYLPLDRLVFFLGGHDLEMVTIRDLLAECLPRQSVDGNLSWGAKASTYRDEIEAALEHRMTAVLVELEIDIDQRRFTHHGPIFIIDHHGDRAGNDRPTSLHQVFDLLGLPPTRWTRWFDLVAANDRGYIPALLELGATRDEIVAIRAADRAAQGTTAEQEIQGERAVAAAQVLAGGRLTLVGLPHDRTAAVADRFAPELGGPGFENLFILGQNGVHFFGTGSLVLSLNEAFPSGWFGGALPDRGFWGHAAPLANALAHLLTIIPEK